MTESSVEPTDVYLSVGSNIAPEQNLKLACQVLANRYGDLHLSNVYRNAAEGFSGEAFLNMVIGFRTTARPEHILAHIEEIHDQAQRVRTANKFSSRTLDLDLLLYGDVVREPLKLPHADIERYSFVARPLAELAPTRKHPVSGKTMQEIWANFVQDAHPLEKVELELLQ